MKIKVLYGCAGPYLVRFNLLTFLGWSLKLHVFLRSDEDTELHDHPWAFWSFVIWGRYSERVEKGWIERKRWSLAYRPADWKHRVTLPWTPTGEFIPCITLVLNKPVSREWGFWKDGKFIPWRTFIDTKKCD